MSENAVPAYLEAPLGDYLQRLAAREPVPGGGSAAALALSLAAGLLAMTANYTLGRRRFAAVAAAMTVARDQAEAIRAAAARMVEEDSRLYLQYRAAAARPRDDPARSAALDRATAAGLDFLEGLADRAAACLPLAALLLEQGNPLLASDAVCAAALARSAFECAEANLVANLPAGDGATAEQRARRAALARRRAAVSREAARIIESYAGAAPR